MGIIHVGAFLSSCVISCLSSNRGIRPFQSNCCRHAYLMAGMDMSHASMGAMNLPQQFVFLFATWDDCS